VIAIKKNANFYHTESVHLYSKEWNFARNYRLLDEEYTRRMEFWLELLAPGQGIYQKNGIPLGITGSWTWIQTGKIKNLPNGDNSRNINSKGSLLLKTNF
jgi:hypothetical protein